MNDRLFGWSYPPGVTTLPGEEEWPEECRLCKKNMIERQTLLGVVEVPAEEYDRFLDHDAICDTCFTGMERRGIGPCIECGQSTALSLLQDGKGTCPVCQEFAESIRDA